MRAGSRTRRSTRKDRHAPAAGVISPTAGWGERHNQYGWRLPSGSGFPDEQVNARISMRIGAAGWTRTTNTPAQRGSTCLELPAAIRLETPGATTGSSPCTSLYPRLIPMRIDAISPICCKTLLQPKADTGYENPVLVPPCRAFPGTLILGPTDLAVMRHTYATLSLLKGREQGLDQPLHILPGL